MSLEFQSEFYKNGMLTSVELHSQDYDMVEIVFKRNLVSEEGKTLIDSKNSMFFTAREFKDFFLPFVNKIKEKYDDTRESSSNI